MRNASLADIFNLVDVTEPVCQTIDSANPQIRQLYINGHFCYVFKFGVVTNGLGIIRHISFYNRDFMTSHPDIVVEKKFGSPDEDKCVHDTARSSETLE